MKRFGWAAWAAIVFLCAIGVAMAQLRNSTITGTVTDQSGGVVPNATVTVTNERTNVASLTKTNAAGVYTVPYLPLGEYTVSVKAPGFQSYTSAGIAVATNVTIQANAELSVGRTTQIVQVRASAAQLQTQSSTISGGVAAHVIDTVPNINNNPLYYATLAAGVVPTQSMYNYEALGVGTTDRQQMSAMRINGGLLGTNDVQLDGVPVQEGAWHTSAVIPNSDALQEVRVQTNNLAADVGGGQGVIQMITKSGTNQFHGDAHYIMRNEALNANSFYNNMTGIPKGKFRVQEGGGSIGGPVIIPKIFNGKDKVFFFAAFDRLSHTIPQQGLLNVPTLDQRNGNFSNTLIQGNGGVPTPVTIYNPWSATEISPNVYLRQPFLDASGNPTENLANAVSQPGSPFPGTSALSSAALLYFQGYPPPNNGTYNGANSGTDAYADNNYSFNGTSPEVRNNLNTRMDVHLGKNSFYASGGMQNGALTGFNAWGSYGTALGFFNETWPGSIKEFNPYAAVGDVITLNPTTLIDVHLGFLRTAVFASYPAPNLFDSSKYTQYGLPTGVQDRILVNGVAPTVQGFSQYSALNPDEWARKNEHQTDWDMAGSLTKIAGKWTLKNGVDYRVYLGNFHDLEFGTPALGIGEVNYTAQYADAFGNALGSYDTLPQQYGTQAASDALGLMGWYLDPGSGDQPSLASKYLAFFSQNDWKVNRRLTLNLGVRYSIQPGPTARLNNIYSMDLTSLNPYATSLVAPGTCAVQSSFDGTCYSTSLNPQAAYGMVAFPGTGTYPRNLWATQWGNISPRLGAEFRINNSTVLRGGWGRIYAPSNTGFNANTLIYGGAAFSPGVYPNVYGNTGTGLPAGTFDQAAAARLIPATGTVQAPALYGTGHSVDYFVQNGYQNAYVDQWNLTLEHRFHGWLASAGYVGSRGADLGFRGYPLNGWFNIPDTTLQQWRSEWIASSGAFDPAQQQVPNPLPALIGGAGGSSGNTTISLMQSEEAYLGLLGQTVYASVASSKYNALQLQLSHSYANGLSAQFSYTWSRADAVSSGWNSSYMESQVQDLAAGGGYNYRNLQDGLSAYDVPRRFVGVVTYQLPFGKGARFASGSPVINAIAGGWTVGTVVTLQSGQPFGPNCGSLANGCIPTGQPLVLPKNLWGWYNGSTPITLPDGRTYTPPEFSYVKYNPDAFTAPVVQFPNGQYAVDQYWYGTTGQYMGQLRTPYFTNTNLTISRTINLTERVKLAFMGQATNLFNNIDMFPSAVDNYYGGPYTYNDPTTGAKIGENTDPTAGAFNLLQYGSWGNQMSMDPRQVTLSMRLTF